MNATKSGLEAGRTRLGALNALAVVIGSVMGFGASLGLLQTELEHIKNPMAALGCDVNILIGCGASLMSPEAHLLGFPNSALGIALFSATGTLGLLLLLRVSMPRIVPLLAGLGTIGGLAFVGYFLYLSATKFSSLCPYCMVVWSGALILAGVLIPFALANIPATANTGKHMQRYTWAWIVSLHLIVVIVVLFSMSDQIGGI